ncbi:copper resistance CopC family protein [Actinomadura alba]|uniref:Copper resistance protein CopC n=1 Tax=Actinomadura alba TaxID=406431 RepID=A0ABR7M1I8_9ACTN|nr:copper resistance CopC family protein [Actinomadura alba]MBC6470901.1 copper resistance protein CopC [Actinomadura alba]
MHGWLSAGRCGAGGDPDRPGRYGGARGRPRRRVRAATAPAALIAAGAAVVLSAGPAMAHATLKSITPGDGSVQTSMPPVVVLTFDQPVNRRYTDVRVTGPGGGQAATGDPAVDGAVVRQRLRPLPRPGRYVVAYRTVSADGHVISGSRRFTFRPAIPSGPASPTPPTADAAAATPVATGNPDEGPSTGSSWVALVVLGGVAVALPAASVTAIRRRRHDD